MVECWSWRTGVWQHGIYHQDILAERFFADLQQWPAGHSSRIKEVKYIWLETSPENMSLRFLSRVRSQKHGLWVVFHQVKCKIPQKTYLAKKFLLGLEQISSLTQYIKHHFIYKKSTKFTLILIAAKSYTVLNTDMFYIAYLVW